MEITRGAGDIDVAALSLRRWNPFGVNWRIKAKQNITTNEAMMIGAVMMDPT